MSGRPKWMVRFEPITTEISAELALVFSGEKAIKVRESIRWPLAMIHVVQPRNLDGISHPLRFKVYLEAEGPISRGELSFGIRDFWDQFRGQRLEEDYAEITFRRVCGKAACARHGERALWGFGRPHPTRPTSFRPHAEFAGPLIAVRPDSRPDWTFKPVYIGVKGNDRPAYALKATTRWENDRVVLLFEENPGDLPSELTAYLGPSFTRKRREAGTVG